eukprot:6205694-Pleurochrysis_carterae.AAC.1
MLLVSLPFAALVVCAVFSPRTNSGSWVRCNVEEDRWPCLRSCVSVFVKRHGGSCVALCVAGSGVLLAAAGAELSASVCVCA